MTAVNVPRREAERHAVQRADGALAAAEDAGQADSMRTTAGVVRLGSRVSIMSPDSPSPDP